MNRKQIKRLNKQAERTTRKGQGNRKADKLTEAQALFFSRDHADEHDKE